MLGRGGARQYNIDMKGDQVTSKLTFGVSREHDAVNERPEAVAVHEWLLEMTRRHHGPDEHTGAALMTMAQVGFWGLLSGRHAFRN